MCSYIVIHSYIYIYIYTYVRVYTDIAYTRARRARRGRLPSKMRTCTLVAYSLLGAFW